MLHFHKTIYLLGFASDLGGTSAGSADGPSVIAASPYLAKLHKNSLQLEWQDILTVDQATSRINSKLAILAMIADICQKLAKKVSKLTADKKFFTVIGGDHSSAIGTWSGASDALKNQGSLGLIWIDAHMDSHTPDTSPTGNIHGMPLACLLGYGPTSLTTILNNHPKLKPDNLCLLGVRSFESGEANLLKELNVRVFFMEEIKQRGLEAVMKEALQIATKNTAGFGISIDIDSIDPEDAPGTGVAEPNGILARELCDALQIFTNHPHLIGLEIAEFNPHLDVDHKTEKLISDLIGGFFT